MVARGLAPYSIRRASCGGNAWAGILYASAVYESNDLPLAARLLHVYVPLAKDVGLPDHMILGDAMLARIAFHDGDVDRAFAILVGLEHIGHARHLPRVVASARLERARLLLLHERAAHPDDPNGVFEIKYTRNDRRRQFSDAVADHGRRPYTNIH